MKTRTTFVVQYEHNSKRVGDPDNWHWTDDFRSDFSDESDAREQLAKRRNTHDPATNKFTRAFRIVKRTITVEEEALDG